MKNIHIQSSNNQQIQQHILRKYQIIRKVGSGAYGLVWKISDKKTKQIYALKKIFDAFQHATDAQRTYRQIMYLRQFHHVNIIKLYHVFRASNDKDIYLVFEYMEADLHHVIRQNILQQIHKQYIIYQIALALRYLHTGQLIHRDLKPSNVLLDSQCFVKVCDFGLIRSVAKVDNHCPIMTENVATRWYRAPEVLMGSTQYTKQVDMWSFGCIIGQIFLGKPMFPGQSTLNQLEHILTFTGIPSNQDIQSLKSDIAKSMIDQIYNIKIKPIKDWFPYAPLEVIDIIRKLLEFNPTKRMTCDQLLAHPFISHFVGKGNESVCKNPFIIKNDEQKLTTKQYRNLIYETLKDQKQKIPVSALSKNSKNNSSKKIIQNQKKSIKNSSPNVLKKQQISITQSNKKIQNQHIFNNRKPQSPILPTKKPQSPSFINKRIEQKIPAKVFSPQSQTNKYLNNNRNILDKKPNIIYQNIKSPTMQNIQQSPILQKKIQSNQIQSYQSIHSISNHQLKSQHPMAIKKVNSAKVQKSPGFNQIIKTNSSHSINIKQSPLHSSLNMMNNNINNIKHLSPTQNVVIKSTSPAYLKRTQQIYGKK